MVVVLFGQPHCGKSTLATKLIKQEVCTVAWNIDGDELRDLFKNKDFSKQGRLKNLNRASDIAAYMNSTGTDIILSLIYPYKEARDYLNGLVEDIKWIYLTYEGERGRESYHVKDFEVPTDGENVLHLDTTNMTPNDCITLIERYLYDIKDKIEVL